MQSISAGAAEHGRSAPWIDIYHPIRGAADRDGQRRLKTLKEILDVVGAKSAADAQCRRIGVAHHDARVGVALDLDDSLREWFAVENDGALAPGHLARQLF